MCVNICIAAQRDVYIQPHTCTHTETCKDTLIISPWILHVPVSTSGLKPLRPGVMGRSSGACQCPCLSQQHVQCLRRATVTHPAQPSRGAAGLLHTEENDPSVWHAQDPKSHRIGLRVQIPTPKGRAGIPANDSEIQRVNALVIWSTEPLRQLSCTFFFFLFSPHLHNSLSYPPHFHPHSLMLKVMICEIAFLLLRILYGSYSFGFQFGPLDFKKMGCLGGHGGIVFYTINFVLC